MATRQMRLAKRIAMAGFTAAAEVDVEDHIAIMAEAAEAFDALVRALSAGDAALDVTAETDRAVLDAAAAVDEVWSPMAGRIADIASPRDLRRPFVSALVDLDEAMTPRVRALFDAVETAHGAATDDDGAARAVALARSQALRCQSMAADAALITLGRERARHADRLGDQVAAFDADLRTLLAGDSERRIAAPNAGAEGKLREAQDIWIEIGVVLEDLAEAGRASALDLQTIADYRDPLADAFNDAAARYQGV